MLAKLLPVIVIVVAAAAGGGGGYFAKTMTAKSPDASAGDHDGEEKSKEKKDKKKKGGHGDETSGATSFMKFSRQFVVPVVRQGRPKSMVILDINLEIDNSLDESVYVLEPRLRDALLAELLVLASQGMLPQMLEDHEKMEMTKAALLETSQEIIGDAALGVLILDLGIQNY